MKKLAFLVGITFLVIGSLSAQNRGNWGNVPPQAVTVQGTLQLQNGQFAVASGNTVYYCPMIGQYVGFIDGLKEGNSITIEGYVYGNTLQPTKLTVSGKSYDFLANGFGGGTNYYAGGYGYCSGPRGCGYNGNWGRRGW